MIKSNLLGSVMYLSSIIIEEQEMESEQHIKGSPSLKQRIFNVRKLPYKQFDNQKYLKENFSPLHSKKQTQLLNEDKTLSSTGSNFSKSKNMEYHYQLILASSPAYKQLQAKYRALKEAQFIQKQEKIQILKQKEEELEKYVTEQQRLTLERQKLEQKREELIGYIEQLREKREMQERQQQQFQVVDVEYLRSMMLSMQYQGGLDIDIDAMSYQELLQLQQKIGKVSKGINQQQYDLLPKLTATQVHQQELCSICYYNVKEGQQIHQLPCKHIFHCECIKQWLMKEKVCPLCKQEVNEEKK